MVREGLSEGMTFELKPRGEEEATMCHLGAENLRQQGDSICKGPEVRTSTASLRLREKELSGWEGWEEIR